ncbi:MAG: bifunctional precorrin-2 dehydrogenase/sirohydrochlorin ferrochelatase [Bilophila wadsworthia]
MHYYPVFLELSGQSCLVVGAGAVGCRKIASLLECPIERLHVIDLAEPDTNLQVLLEDKRVSFTKRPFTPSDVEGCALVFAATSNRQTNDAVARACTERGILCNCADAPKDSSFIVPALVEQGNIAIALSTGGASPALARKIREDLETWLGEHYTGISELLMRLRPLVLACITRRGRIQPSSGALWIRPVRSPAASVSANVRIFAQGIVTHRTAAL